MGSTLRVTIILEAVLLSIADSSENLFPVAVLIRGVVPVLDSLVLLTNVSEGNIPRGGRRLSIGASLLIVSRLLVGRILESGFIEPSQDLLPSVGPKSSIESLLLVGGETTGPFNKLIELLLGTEYLYRSGCLLLRTSTESPDHRLNKLRGKALGDQSLLGSRSEVTTVG